ncbi:MAG: hypothetical protein LBQ30_00430 [Treponema sp.]|jgi:hypothetical protein|nr:hypothetical protein [Treponema sp.]
MAYPREPVSPALEAIPPVQQKPIALAPALVSGVIALGLIRSGLPTFFFLVPLGFMAYGYDSRSAWVSALVAAAGNGLLSLVWPSASAYPWLNTLYFTMLLFVFTWIVAPFPGAGRVSPSTAYRLIIGAVIGALTCGYSIAVTREHPEIKELLRSQVELLRSLSLAAAGTDVVQRSLLEQQADPERILAVIASVALRGGGVVACGLIFFVNRQLSLVCVGLIRRIRRGSGMIQFHTAPWLIWILSFSLLGVLAGTFTGIAPVEIAAWNIISLCAMLYLAQGGGILLYFLSRRTPLMRVGLTVLGIFLICSPGINAFILGALGILGIAEHWVPFRAPKQDGSSSTPGM